MAQFRFASKRRLPMEQPSDLAAWGAVLLLVDDTSDRLGLLWPDGRFESVRLPGVGGKASNLEGVACDPERGKLFVAAEESSRLLRYAFVPGRGAPKLEKELALPYGGKRNKGVEGLAFLPAAASPTGRAHLAVAKEGKPRALALLDAEGEGDPVEVDLVRDVKEACEDFSALAFDPASGHLFLASDESAQAVELELAGRKRGLEARPVQVVELRDDGGKRLEKIEGIAFDPRGDLLAVCEERRMLYRFARGSAKG